jgi:hypothetical protein
VVKSANPMRRRRRRNTSALPIDMLPLVAAIFAGQYFILVDSSPGISSHLSASLAYMVGLLKFGQLEEADALLLGVLRIQSVDP